MVKRVSMIVATGLLFVGVPTGAVAQDADGDGHAAAARGGDDCDDDDANRYPGNAEVADRDGHDEDCDPTTFGWIDEDGDGHPAAWACNVDAGGRSYCGSDCDDANRSVHPNQIDICNNRDDNCDGERDEDQPCDLLQAFREDPELTLEGLEQEAQARRERREAVRERTEEIAPREEVGVVGPVRQVPVAPRGAGPSCADAVQGEIAWNYEGNTRWAQANVQRLCEGAEDSTEPARCFDRVMHGGVDRGDGATRWTWQDALALCRGSRDAGATVDCFRDAIADGQSRDHAIKRCSI